MAGKKKPEKRERILTEAIALFSRNGYTQTTISEIAKAAGVSFGTVFTYYENKEALFRAAVLDRMQSWEPLFLEISSDEEASPLETIKRMINNHIGLFANEEQYLRLVQYVLGQPDRFEDLFRQLEDFLERFLEVLRPIIQKGQECGQLHVIDPKVVASSYFSFINGVRLMRIGSFEDSFWIQYREQALRLFGPKERAE